MEKKYSSVAVIVPFHNEALVIDQTLESVCSFVSKRHVYCVDDASTDATAQIAKRYTKNILKLPQNLGKADALNSAIVHFSLTKRYRYILPLDADTRLTASFIPQAVNTFERHNDCIAVVGKIQSLKSNWLSAYRAWEYEITQSLHKYAQSILNAIIVCSGCATLYKSSLFTAVNFPLGTLTEDMDLTFTIHRKKLGKIYYQPKAIVTTQDPQTLKDYTRQTLRWFTGFWQCVEKHKLPWGGQMIDLEGAMLAMEGIFSGLLIILLFLFFPVIITEKPLILFFAFFTDGLLFMLPTLFLTRSRQNRTNLYRMAPFIYAMRCITAVIFLASSFRAMMIASHTYKWNKVKRYSL